MREDTRLGREWVRTHAFGELLAMHTFGYKLGEFRLLDEAERELLIVGAHAIELERRRGVEILAELISEKL